MAKTARIISMAIGAALLAACGEPQVSRDLLFLGGPTGVTVVEAGAASPAFRAPSAVTSSDWSAAVRTVRNSSSTRVIASNPVTGTRLWARSLPGRLQAKVVSKDGDSIALGPAQERYSADGRARTELVVARRGGPRASAITLQGNFEPEAFSVDSESLFVLQYLPARSPTRYQVRRLDLATGRVHGVYTEDKELQEAMRGTARVQAMSRDGRRLYTLYTLRSGRHGKAHAFIHVLSLDELWAHCIDLPGPFATSPESATALTVAPDGKRLYVANTAAGTVADVDTERLAVTRTGTINFAAGETAHAALQGNGTLYVASGPRVAAVDTSSLSERQAWLMDEKISGIQVAGDATRLYVALRERIAIVDARSGERLETFDPPGIERIDRLGRGARSVDRVREEITCAC